MRLELKIQFIENRLEELLEALRYARKNKPEGYFTWEERMAIHQCRASWLRTLEKLEPYEAEQEMPEAAEAIVKLAIENRLPEKTERKIKEISDWLQISRQSQ